MISRKVKKNRAKWIIASPSAVEAIYGLCLSSVPEMVERKICLFRFRVISMNFVLPYSPNLLRNFPLLRKDSTRFGLWEFIVKQDTVDEH